MKKTVLLFLFVSCLFACKEDIQPKPKAFLALSYPTPVYEKVDLNCPFSFEKNEIAQIAPPKNNGYCWFNLVYPNMKGTIYLTYKPVNNNLRKLIKDAQNLPLKHTLMASSIEGKQYINSAHDVYGTFYKVAGNAASQAQFYITDSTTHFLTGSIYFNVEPNFDSIYPAAQYLEHDIRHLMESIRWVK